MERTHSNPAELSPKLSSPTASSMSRSTTVVNWTVARLTAEAGLLSSWATPALSLPKVAKRSCWRSMASWAT